MNLPERVKNVAGEVGKGFKRFLNWLGEASPVSDSRMALGISKTETQKEGSKPTARLAPYQRGIRVQCSSCGVIHDLTVVCYRCGEPLCDDVKNCRNSQYLGHLETSVVVCPKCYSGGGPSNS